MNSKMFTVKRGALVLAALLLFVLLFNMTRSSFENKPDDNMTREERIELLKKLARENK